MNISLFAAIPEIFMASMIVVILLLDAFVGEHKKSLNTVFTIIALIGGYILQVAVFVPGKIQVAFGGMFILDSMAEGMKLFTYVLSIVTVIYIKHYINDKKIMKGEFYAVFLFSVLGMLVMISANNLLVLYVGLELLSLALYGLVALNRDSVKSTEAAMKFFILGALASGLLLYGISFVYGATGVLQLEQVFKAIYNGGGQNTGLLVFGLVFIVAGLVFKLGLVPFHMWVPDVYEGSQLAATTIIGSVTKLAGVVFIIRFLIGGLVLLSSQWSVMLAMLAFLSLFIGNIVAIAQTNIKRLLGYSTVAHMGFVAFGLMTVTVNGIAAVLFYTIVYAITALAGFGVLLLLSKDGFECEQIDDLKGLNKSHPVYAGIMLLVMFSLAGIPPLAGFYAKFTILQALIEVGYIKSAVFAVVLSLIGAFYYLRVVKVMYFDEKDAGLQVANVGLLPRSVLVINGGLLLLIGVLPSGLMHFCMRMVTG
jgi:NADH-quinone oxidoreductase subunit N